MKMQSAMCVVVLVGGVVASADAASPVSPGARTSLVTSDGLERFTIGADYSTIERDLVDRSGFPASLDTATYGVFVGWQPLRWLMAYGLFGHADSKVGIEQLGDGFRYWAAGLHLNLWSYDVADPAFLAGRWTVRATGERAAARLSDGEWSEFVGSARLHWENFVESMETTTSIPYSLGAYVGLLFSALDVETGRAPFVRKYDGEHDWGLAFGVEINASHNTTFAVGFEHLDTLSWTASVRYSF